MLIPGHLSFFLFFFFFNINICTQLYSGDIRRDLFTVDMPYLLQSLLVLQLLWHEL